MLCPFCVSWSIGAFPQSLSEDLSHPHLLYGESTTPEVSQASQAAMTCRRHREEIIVFADEDSEATWSPNPSEQRNPKEQRAKVVTTVAAQGHHLHLLLLLLPMMPPTPTDQIQSQSGMTLQPGSVA